MDDIRPEDQAVLLERKQTAWKNVVYDAQIDLKIGEKTNDQAIIRAAKHRLENARAALAIVEVEFDKLNKRLEKLAKEGYVKNEDRADVVTELIHME